MHKDKLLHWLDVLNFCVSEILKTTSFVSWHKNAHDWCVKYGNAFYNFLMNLKHSELTHWSENESFNEDLILELCMNINKFDIISFSVL